MTQPGGHQHIAPSPAQDAGRKRDGQPRLFVALPLPDEQQRLLAETMKDLQARCRFRTWVHPADLHVTLTFIGSTAPERQPDIETALERVAARSLPLPLKLGPIGTFGQTQAPRVLWIGLQGDGLKALRSLQADVASELALLGYPPEERPYSPHITLARQYNGETPARADWSQAAPYKGDTADQESGWQADRLVLFRSHTRQPPMYEPLRTIAFHAGG